MKWFLVFTTTFVGVCGCAAALAWLGGYDFDQRGPNVAYWTGVVWFVAACFGYAKANQET